jgi:hypothetical protein
MLVDFAKSQRISRFWMVTDASDRCISFLHEAPRRTGRKRRKAMSQTLTDWVTEKELAEEAKARNMRVTPRTLRKWRKRRLIPYTKIGRETLYPKNWSAELKVVKPRQ